MDEEEQGATMGTNTLLDERRVGKFSIASDSIRNCEYEYLLKIMANFLIVGAEMMYAANAVEYVAYSPLFGVTDQAEEPPTYLIEMDKDGSVHALRGYRVEKQ